MVHGVSPTHTEPNHDPRETGADGAGADHTHRLSVQIESKETRKREIRFSNTVLCAVDSSVERQDETDTVLGHGMR